MCARTRFFESVRTNKYTLNIRICGKIPKEAVIKHVIISQSLLGRLELSCKILKNSVISAVTSVDQLPIPRLNGDRSGLLSFQVG